MSETTKIEWTDATWSPVTGCTPASEGCTHCYALRDLHRRRKPEEPQCHPERLRIPTKWKKGRRVFVCSMGDLFHPDVPSAFIREVYGVMRYGAPQHTFQILTKRPERMVAEVTATMRAPNIWHGVTVESQRQVWRVHELVKMPETLHFVSCEPLLEEVVLPLQEHEIEWVIVGGESGPGARQMKPEWVRKLRDQATAFGAKFFFKQWGGRHRTQAGRVLDGRTWEEMP